MHISTEFVTMPSRSMDTPTIQYLSIQDKAILKLVASPLSWQVKLQKLLYIIRYIGDFFLLNQNGYSSSLPRVMMSLCVLQVDHIDISDDEFEDAHEHMDMEEDIFGADDAMCRRHQPLSKSNQGVWEMFLFIWWASKISVCEPFNSPIVYPWWQVCCTIYVRNQMGLCITDTEPSLLNTNNTTGW